MTTLIKAWHFFSPFLKPYKISLLVLLLLPPLWCLAETVAPYSIKLVIDQISSNHLSHTHIQRLLIYTALAYAGLILILELAIRTSNMIWMSSFPHIHADIQSKVLEFIQAQPVQFIYDRLAGNLINKYRNLTDSFEKLFKILLYGIYPTLMAFLFSLAFIAVISKTFSAIFFGWFVAMNFTTLGFFKPSVIAAKNQSRLHSHLIGYISNHLSNATMLLAFSRPLAAEAAFRRMLDQNRAATQKLEFVTFKADSWRSLLSWILLVMMMIFLSFGWQQGWISLGDFSFVTAICFYVRRSIWATSLQLAEFFKELGVLQDALTLIADGQAIPQASATLTPLSIATSCSIKFQDIQFGYSTDKMLFRHLNLQIPAGQKLGIAGNSGAGKTSLVQLLLRLYDPQQGTILLNGQDYRQLSVDNVRALFSYAPQNASLLHQSIFDNIAIGKPDASQQEVYQAAQVCLCDEFISSLAMGYQTIVGEGGYKLSGGQRQRIALARAYIKKAPVFVLDEALSGLDTDLEEQLLEQLCMHLTNHTIILISHRNSALLKMDRVITLKQGQIILDGASTEFPMNF